jgi:prenyltransferase beta subunit
MASTVKTEERMMETYKNEQKPLPYVSNVIVIPRGLMVDNVVWRYIYDSMPSYGWNFDIRFDDSAWFSGQTPIGWDPFEPPRIFIKTKLYFVDIYLRKVFWVENIPPGSSISIASDDGAEVWINGRKVLNGLNSTHGAIYWNYRVINISSYLNIGENLIAVHVRNFGGICFFDSELVLELKSLEESIFDFVYGRWNPDGGFSNNHIDDTFYATSILKMLESTDLLEKDKVGFWITSHKYLSGDFGCVLCWTYPIIESLKNIGLELDGESAERLITVLLNSRSNDGSWGGELYSTCRVIEAITSLNALNRTSLENTIRYIKSLQGLDGGFKNRLEDKESSLRFTFYALRTLHLLNALDAIDRNKTINFIMSCYRDGGFSERPTWQDWIEPTYFGIKSLEILNSLNKVNSNYVVVKILSWLGYKGSVGYLFGDYCAVKTLETLNRLYELDKKKIINNVMKFYNIIDGGFKGGSWISYFEHSARTLSNIGMLERIDAKKMKEWCLSIWPAVYSWSTGIIHSAVYSLLTLKETEKIDKSGILQELLRRKCIDGGFSATRESKDSNVWETYLAIDILVMLNMTYMDPYATWTVTYKLKNDITDYIISLKNPEGDFNYSRNEKYNSVRATALATIILSMLDSISKIDKDKTANLILGYQRDDGSFGDIFDTYLSLRALKALGKLNDRVLAKAVNYVLSIRNLDGGFGWWKGDMWSWLDSTDYATSILYQFKKLKKYYINVEATPPSAYLETYGSGWYLEGSEVTLSIRPTTIDFGNGTRLIFTKWTGDLTSEDPNVTVNVTSPISLNAIWKTQYYLTINANPSFGGKVSPSSGWHDSGTQIQISAIPALNYRFSEWTGSGIGCYTGKLNSITITIGGPIVEVANFVEVATVTFSVSGLDPNVIEIVLTVDGIGYSYRDLPKVFTWDVGSLHNFTWSSLIQGGSGKQFVWSSTFGLSSHQTESVKVPSGGGSITARYKTQYFVLVQTYGLGSDFWGNSVILDGVGYKVYDGRPLAVWIDSGRILNYNWISPIQTSTSGKRYVIISTQSDSITINSSRSVTGSYNTQYQWIFFAGGLGSDASGTILTVDGVNYEYTNLPVSFWWDSGSSHSYYYQHYVGTHTSGKRYANHNPERGSITISTSSMIRSEYHVEYQLTIRADPWGSGSISLKPQSPDNWYDPGENVTLSVVNSPIGFLIQHFFTGWSGDLEEATLPATIVMDKPKTVIARWRGDYALLLFAGPITPIIASLYHLVHRKKYGKLIEKKKRKKPTETIVLKSEEERGQIIEYLRKLEELYKLGKISREAYEVLKAEYEEKLQQNKY